MRGFFEDLGSCVSGKSIRCETSISRKPQGIEHAAEVTSLRERGEMGALPKQGDLNLCPNLSSPQEFFFIFCSRTIRNHQKQHLRGLTQ